LRFSFPLVFPFAPTFLVAFPHELLGTIALD